jgi:hypothetical protein
MAGCAFESQQSQLVATKNGSSRVMVLSKEAVDALKVCQLDEASTHQEFF